MPHVKPAIDLIFNPIQHKLLQMIITVDIASVLRSVAHKIARHPGI